MEFCVSKLRFRKYMLQNFKKSPFNTYLIFGLEQRAYLSDFITECGLSGSIAAHNVCVVSRAQ